MTIRYDGWLGKQHHPDFATKCCKCDPGWLVFRSAANGYEVTATCKCSGHPAATLDEKLMQMQVVNSR